jgi:3-oxoacyl-[acyl-carrier-protein] synthase-3
MPVDTEVLAKRLNTFVMHGSKVWDFAIDTVPRVIRELLARRGLAPRDLDLLVLHQSNLRMIEALMGSLELPMDRTVTTIEEYGNTAAASIPITLQRAWEQRRLQPGSRVMLCGFGGGLSWGAALLEW